MVSTQKYVEYDLPRQKQSSVTTYSRQRLGQQRPRSQGSCTNAIGRRMRDSCFNQQKEDTSVFVLPLLTSSPIAFVQEPWERGLRCVVSVCDISVGEDRILRIFA